MTTEQRKPSEEMSPAEQGRAIFQLQKHFFAGERRLPTYLDTLHSWRIGDLYPTEFGSPRGTVSYEVGNKTFQVQMGVHYTGPNTGTLSNLERTLKVRIIEDVLNSNNIASTNHTVVSVNSGYLAKIKSNELVEHTEGKVKVFRNGNQVELNEGDPATYEYLRELLSPVIDAKSDKVVVSHADLGFDHFDEALDNVDAQLGVTGWLGSDVIPAGDSTRADELKQAFGDGRWQGGSDVPPQENPGR